MANYITDRRLLQWQTAKKETQHLARILRAGNDRRWSTVAQCSNAVTLKYCPECRKLHILPSWACRFRLCPTCQIRRARAIGGQAMAAYQWLDQQGKLEGVRMLLVTLTQKNVPGSELRAEIDRLLEALVSMRHARDVRRWMIGSARNIEITYNPEAQTYHPHVHMIAMIAPGAPETMTEGRFWRGLWARLMALHYDPVCDVRPIDDTSGAVCEVSKYVAKSQHLLENLSDDDLLKIVPTIDDAISGRRLISYTGIWREARKVLQQADEPDPAACSGDEQDDVCGCGAALVEAMMIWNGCEYVAAAAPMADIPAFLSARQAWV